MTKKLEACWDYDYIKYTIAAAAGEKRSVVVTHKKSNKKKEFKSRTEFYGHHKKKAGGWLAEVNLERAMDNKAPFTPDDFIYEDKQTPEPLEFVLSSVKNHIKNVLEKTGIKNYYGYIGKGDSQRVEQSTLVKYKGSRATLLKPVHLEAVEHYLVEKHNAQIIRVIEADDQCTIDCFNNDNRVLVCVDKDYYGNDLTLYTHGSMDAPKRIRGFGNLYINDKGDVKGEGYLWWLHQVMSGDDSDEYWANSACPEKLWGDKSSYKLLVNCKNEKEAWEAVIKGYKKLYPEPKLFTGWRGDEFDINWKYVLNENCIMSRMMTTHDYKFILDEELNRFGIKYD